MVDEGYLSWRAIVIPEHQFQSFCQHLPVIEPPMKATVMSSPAIPFATTLGRPPRGKASSSELKYSVLASGGATVGDNVFIMEGSGVASAGPAGSDGAVVGDRVLMVEDPGEASAAGLALFEGATEGGEVSVVVEGLAVTPAWPVGSNGGATVGDKVFVVGGSRESTGGDRVCIVEGSAVASTGLAGSNGATVGDELSRMVVGLVVASAPTASSEGEAVGGKVITVRALPPSSGGAVEGDTVSIPAGSSASDEGEDEELTIVEDVGKG